MVQSGVFWVKGPRPFGKKNGHNQLYQTSIVPRVCLRIGIYATLSEGKKYSLYITGLLKNEVHKQKYMHPFRIVRQPPLKKELSTVLCPPRRASLLFRRATDVNQQASNMQVLV